MADTKKIESPWALTQEDVCALLATSEQGLSDDEARKRLTAYGRNAFKRKERKSAIGMFLKQLASPLVFILIGAAVITAVLNEWIEVVVISLAVLVNAGLGFYREYHAESTLAKLGTFIKVRARVMRNGFEQEIDPELLVPGDLIRLSYGSRIPADARIIRATNARVDEAVLTGESAAVQKQPEPVSAGVPVADRTNMAHAGTLMVDGFALAVVVSTGSSTEIGRIADLVSSTRRAQTPIQKGLAKLAWVIFAVVLVVIVGIFMLGISRGEPLLSMLVLSAAVSVGAVPEALPITLTVILSAGTERLARKKGVTKTLLAAETLGSTSLIMTDKTGTLTEANMQLVGVFTRDALIAGTATMASLSTSGRALLAAALPNVDVIVENPQEEPSAWQFSGKPFEVRIAAMARDSGLDVSRFASGAVSSITVPFSSVHKFSVSREGGVQTVMGAPDILLERSTIEAADAQAIGQWITDASERGERLIALARAKREVQAVDDVAGLEFLGVLSFRDPIRASVPAAIRRIESLGIQVVMVTGDLKGTAIAVARELGWDVSAAHALSGAELRSLSDDELTALLPSKKIFARVTPEDKMRIGNLYRKLGEVVAMTGDGVNDAPSLKAMDIGVALGSGSDVAKSAADLVLLDDNFSVIAAAVQEGRRMLINIRKAFVYLMSNSLDEVFVIGGSLIMGLALPLTAIQIIWVNLCTGSLPALAYAYDEDFDHRSAKRHSLKSIFTREVNILTFGIGIVTSLLLFAVYLLLVRAGIEVPLARSIFFVCFSTYILVVAYSFRSLRKPLFSYPAFSNWRLNASILVAGALLAATMLIPFMRELFGLAPLPAVWLWFVLGWLVLNVLLVEGAKYLFRTLGR